MSIDPSNPYASPPAVGGAQPPLRPVTGMDYMRMITYVFENPNWFMTLLLGGLCSIIPVIGPIVLQGYRYETVIVLLGAGGGGYRDFDFNRFGDYLMRGLWPFLVTFACSFALVPFYIAIVLAAIAGGEKAGWVIGLFQMAMAIIMPAAMFVLQPMLLRSALTMDFMQAFQLEWVKDFISRVWAELLLGVLFLGVVSMVLIPVGLLACCVGVLLVAPVVALVQANLLFQVYSLYLSRGGTPIPIKMSAQPVTPTMP
jgi:hypothetical protein